MTLHLKLQQRPIPNWTDAHIVSGQSTPPFIVANSPAVIRVLYTNVAGDAVEDATGITDILAEVWASPAMKTGGLLIAPAAVQIATAEPILSDWNTATDDYYTAEIEMTAEETAAAITVMDAEASNLQGWLEIRGTKDGENILLGSGPIVIYKASTGGTPPDGPDVYYTAAEVDAAIAAGGGGGGGSGTVTSVSVTTANGVSGTVATATTTPAITLTLGAITPSTVRGLTITTTTGTLTIANGVTLTASNNITLATDGTGTRSLNIGTGGTLGTAAFTAATAYAVASHTHDAADITSGTFGHGLLGTGGGSGSKYLRDDMTWQGISGGGDLLAANNLSDVANPGIALVNLTGEISPNLVFAGPSTGGADNPYFRALVTADMPSGTATESWVTGTFTGSTNLATLGTVVTGTWNGTAIATNYIADNAVTNAKLSTVSTATIKGRTTAGTGNVEDLTATQATALLNAMVGDSGAGGTKGLVPAPSAGDAAAGKVLGAGGTWVAGGAPGGSTTQVQLNNAGAFGGVAGLTANLTTGAVTQLQTALGTTTAAGLTLTNTTAAAVGAQQVSPSCVWTGQGWKTTATAASQAVDFRAYVLPVQGTTAPSGTLKIQYQINGGGWTDGFDIVQGISGGGVQVVAQSFGGTASSIVNLRNNANNSGSGLGLSSANLLGFFSGNAATSALTTMDVILSRSAAANLRQGAADAAAPVAQTLSVQSVVAGTSNTAGANWTFSGSQGTGTGAGGDIIFKTAPAGGSGSSQNALVEMLRVSTTGISVALKTTMSGGRQSAYVAKTTTYAIAAATDYCINCTSGSFTVTLPTAVGIAGQEFIIKNSGTGVITIATTSSQTIDSGASGSITLPQYTALSVMSDGANWIII